MASAGQVVHWTEEGTGTHTAAWRAASGFPPPKHVVPGDDRSKAAVAYRMASEGTGIVWKGDFQNARQLLAAMRRRADRRQRRYSAAPSTAFHEYRQRRAQRARALGMLLIPVAPGCVIPLRRAPDVREACAEAGLSLDESFVLPLRDLLGMIGAHEWRRKGVEIPALGARIHPHYGVFSPVRGEYVDLVANAPLPALDRAQDIGTGTGVLAAVLANRGVARVAATDRSPAALECARENMARLGFDDRVDVFAADPFPNGKASVVVCNPPWIPAKPASTLDQGVYDPGSAMLRAFLSGLGEQLEPGGEGWLILSDLAERLELRSRDQLLALFAASGLEVVDRLDARPKHARANDSTDPLHAARAAEVTSLWRLCARATS